MRHSFVMKIQRCFLLLVMLLGVFPRWVVPDEPVLSPASAAQVMVIPVNGMIERALLYVVRRSLAEAAANEVDAVILHMDTPGGRVRVTEEIMRMLIDLPSSITTYTFVDKDALSAGALIAISTERIFMAPGSRIGASAVVTATGDLEEGDMKEKHVSALVALARSAATSKGHDPDLVEAMIRKDVAYSVGEDEISREGQLLTLTDSEASRLVTDTDGKERPLLARGTVESLETLLIKEGLQDATVKTVRLTNAERIARYIELFSFIFLAGGLLGIYIEFRTPGFGVPGMLGGLMLAIFFWGHRIAGLSGDIELLLFGLGLLLLLVELFILPGFGIAGISGIVLIIASIFFSMVAPVPGSEWFQLPPLQVEFALQQLGLGLLMALVSALIVGHYLPKTRTFQHLVLSTVLSSERNMDITTPDAEHGNPIAGHKGVALTPLRPAGFALINGKRINVVAQGEFIDKDTAVCITQVHGNRIVVDHARESSSVQPEVT